MALPVKGAGVGKIICNCIVSANGRPLLKVRDHSVTVIGQIVVNVHRKLVLVKVLVEHDVRCQHGPGVVAAAVDQIPEGFQVIPIGDLVRAFLSAVAFQRPICRQHRQAADGQHTEQQAEGCEQGGESVFLLHVVSSFLVYCTMSTVSTLAPFIALPSSSEVVEIRITASYSPAAKGRERVME